ncbi:hypothetical protein KKC08_04075 [Patescibacteria group bacterium]|nr:hypothetical protein [Patescibacteria group bacterium]MCG2702301.1 hypothetical protein [Candidatus Parcubacteria bacterium]MBU4264580.1 hypothetical protein [Patescibacteria group bacterium]MBU4390248.1 hypothetical protein [Patescibacteria group bacterium]MBU4397318.1 hypothetical protein [Patescibacteria group bacterium]
MIFVKSAYAVCPVCVVAVGSGLLIAEKLGIDDLIAAIWIGAFTTALAITLAPKIKWPKFPKAEIVWTIIFYLLNVAVLQIQGKLNNPYCKIWGVCRIWLGITIGTILIWLGSFLDITLRKLNKGKVFFPFQKVICPLLLVTIVSFIFYWFIC